MAATYGAINPADMQDMWSGGLMLSDPGINTSNMLLSKAYQDQEAQKQRMANESEKQMKLQTQMMQAEFDKMKSTADTSGQLAAQFLEAWGSSLNDVKAMYGDAAGVLKGLLSGESGGAAKPDLAGLQDLADTMKQEYTSYKEQYAPMEKELMMSARELAGTKKNILTDLAAGGGQWMNVEGAAARAKADTAIQGELANQAEARRLMAMGIDPSSGRFGALTRKGAIDLAGETVRAMNLARQTEKTQGLARGIAVAGAINPAEFSNIAMGIRSQGTELLKGAGSLEQAGANAQAQYLQTVGNLGTAYANMASGLAANITNPLAEMAGYYSGLSGGAVNPTVTPAINPVANYQAITQAPATVMQGSNQLLGTKATEKAAVTQPKTAADMAYANKLKTYGTYIPWE
jgi:hypothetical protein